jgi:hypothetical protein
MRHLILIAIFILAVATAASAQAKSPKPDVVQPNAEQKAKLIELARNWEAQAREADAARDKYLIALMGTLAELGLKPSETAITWNEKGEPVFNRATPTTAKAPDTKPEAKP